MPLENESPSAHTATLKDDSPLPKRPQQFVDLKAWGTSKTAAPIGNPSTNAWGGKVTVAIAAEQGASCFYFFNLFDVF